MKLGFLGDPRKVIINIRKIFYNYGWRESSNFKIFIILDISQGSRVTGGTGANDERIGTNDESVDGADVTTEAAADLNEVGVSGRSSKSNYKYL